MWDPILMISCVVVLFITLFWFVWTIQDDDDIGSVVTKPNNFMKANAFENLYKNDKTCNEMSVGNSKLLFEQLNGDSYRKGFIDLTGQSITRAELYAAREVEKWLDYETKKPLYFILGPGYGPLDSMSKMTKHINTFINKHYGDNLSIQLSRISNPGVLILRKKLVI